MLNPAPTPAAPGAQAPADPGQQAPPADPGQQVPAPGASQAPADLGQAAPKGPSGDNLNVFFKESYNKAKAVGEKEALATIQEIFGTNDPVELQGFAASLKKIQSKGGEQELSKLSEQNQSLINSNNELQGKLNSMQSDNELIGMKSDLSKVVNGHGPKGPQYHDAIMSAFLAKYEIKDNKVFEKGQKIHELFQDSTGTRPKTASDIIHEMKKGVYSDFFGIKSNLDHIDTHGEGTDKENYKPTIADRSRPDFRYALEMTNQLNASMSGDGFVNLRKMEPYIKAHNERNK